MGTGRALGRDSEPCETKRGTKEATRATRQEVEKMTDTGDATAPFFGFIGAAAALVFSSMGAAYGTAKSGVGIAAMGVMRPELVMKSIVPVVMAGVLGIYGFIISVLIAQKVTPEGYKMYDGYAHLASGLACGLSGLSAGMAIGVVGDSGVRANAQQPKLFVGMIIILIFAEALALYGLSSASSCPVRAARSEARPCPPWAVGSRSKRSTRHPTKQAPRKSESRLFAVFVGLSGKG